MTDAVLDFKPLNLPDNVQVEMGKLFFF